MSRKLTEGALGAIALAREEARTLQHAWLGTEHLLVGLVRARCDEAGSVVERLGANESTVRWALSQVAPAATRPPRNVYLPLTARAVAAFERAATVSRSLGHPSIGTAHLLLGLLGDEESTGCKLLRRLGVSRSRLRSETRDALQRLRPGAPLPETRIVEPPLFICPRAHGPMEKLRDEHGLEIAVCPECLGTFLPAGALGTIARSRAAGTLDGRFHPVEGG